MDVSAATLSRVSAAPDDFIRPSRVVVAHVAAHEGDRTMISITPDAIDAIKAVMGPKQGGLRITAMSAPVNGSGPGLALEALPEPEAGDEVVDAEGAQLYLDEAAAGMLDGKVLDAEREGDAVRFSIIDPG
jgi:iron-sulfur cluster assembly protein